MPKTVGLVWAPRMGRPEGSLSSFPFLPVTFQSPAGESGAWASKSNSRLIQSILGLLLYSSLQASVSPTVEWTPPETLQVCELGKVLLRGNKWEALCSVTSPSCLVLEWEQPPSLCIELGLLGMDPQFSPVRVT